MKNRNQCLINCNLRAKCGRKVFVKVVHLLKPNPYHSHKLPNGYTYGVTTPRLYDL